MKKIYKYQLGHGNNVVTMPKGAKILAAQNQSGEPTIWAIVDPSATPEKRYFEVIGTGDLFEDNVRLLYINTVQSGFFVWHVFEVTGG